MFTVSALLSDERIDEIALNSLETIPARTVVAVGTGAVISLNFGWVIAAGWLVAALLCEAWTWAVTRPHVRGHVTKRQRGHYVVSLVTAVLVWTALGMHAWRSDLPMQQAAAVAIWTSQLLCAASFAFQTPRGFAVIAIPPSVAMAIAPFLAPHEGWRATATVFAMFVLCILYAVIQARQTAGFRQALDETQLQLRRSEARAEASAQAKTEFLANMSHELRTPLTAIIGFSGLLHSSDRLEPEDSRRAGLIHGASTALLTALNDVLDVSKMEAGALDLDLQPFDFAAVVRDTVGLVQEQAQAKGLLLRLEGPQDALPVVGDANRLRQVLLNLLTNALKFTHTGGVTVVVETSHAGEARRLHVAVKDTGIGVAPDKQRLLFERFSQADGSISREFGGTGLGLAISKRLLQLMDGSIGVDSVERRGSTFWFEVVLPCFEGDLAPLSAPALMLDRIGPLRVLIAEDHPVNRDLMVALLQPFDLDIDVVSDGAQALQAVQSKTYDLVLMDIQMPVMDGVDATRRIRALPTDTATVPIVAMTANVFPEQIESYRKAGMTGHIGKPIDPRLLFAAIAAYAPPPV